jgi:hypothetical protein
LVVSYCCHEPESLRKELRELRRHGTRVTIAWSCGEMAAPFCTTGVIVEVGADFVEVRGCSPTVVEAIGCTGAELSLLDTVIPLRNVCAVFENVPAGRKAAVPVCCGVSDPPHRA